MPNADRTLDSILADLVIANRILANEGVLDDFGHVSVRDPADPTRFWLSRSRSPEIVSREDLIRFDLDGVGESLNGRRPYLETILHARTFAARPDVMSVVHHHARPVLPFTLGGAPLRPVFHMGSVIGASVPLWDSATDFGDTNMLIDDAPKANSLARALGAGPTVLLRSHGANCVGRSIAEVVFICCYMKENAELQLAAEARFGGADNVTYLTEGEVRMTAAMLTSEAPMKRAWDYRRARAGFAGI